MLKQLLLFLVLTPCLSAQTYVVSGKITDEHDHPLPFSSVSIKGTSLGTNANSEGVYSMKVPAGQQELVFQYVGYKKKTSVLEVNGNKTLDIRLGTENYQLEGVTVTNGEDPAYAVIRQAIKKRKFYLNEVNAYTCKAYIKGLQRLHEFPKNLGKLMKVTVGENPLDSSMLGVVYLSESETKYHFQRPDDVKEIMYSSKVSGDNQAFSFNQLSDMEVNLYQNLTDLDGLSDHPFVSPINENALFYYRYKLLGTTFEDGKMINKIQVTPKNKTEPCFRGIIYIQENTWRIHSCDLYLTKDAKIDFVDTVTIRQLYAAVKDSTWMPISLNFSFNFKFMGFKGNGYFNAVLSDYDLAPVFPKRFFKNELLKVEDDANKKDSSYWQQNRPIPLTKEEEDDYRKKDSIARIHNSKAYKDSTDKRYNRFRLGSLMIGYGWRNSSKKLYFNTSGIINSGVQYNTVEGVNASMIMALRKEYEDNRYMGLSATARYGFSNYLWGGRLNWTYLKRPEKFEYFQVQAGSMVEQFNPQGPISPLVNTIYTLLVNENYMKLYKKTYANFYYRRELVNGLTGIFKTEYAERDPLRNTSYNVWIDDKNKLFTSNDPRRPNTEDSSFTTNNIFTVELGFSIRFKQKYYTRPHEKVILGSKYPIINILYRKAIPGLNTKTDFDLAVISIEDDLKLGLFGTFSYRLKGGYFLSTRNMQFMDYRHFNGNQTVLANTDYLNSFKLLPYYAYSTNKWYAEGHAEHHFNGFIFNKIPLIKRLNIQEVVGGHVLFNDQLDNYYELNFGIEHIFQVLRVDYVLGYGLPGQSVKQGVLFGLDLKF